MFTYRLSALQFLLFCSVLVVDAESRTYASSTAIEALERTWVVAKNEIYPSNLTEHFSDAAFKKLRAEALSAKSLYEFTPVLDDFLASLGYSHTTFVDNRSDEFFLFRSMFGEENATPPAHFHLGVRLKRHEFGWQIYELWDGLPAKVAGLRRGDVIKLADKLPFHPFLTCNPNGLPVELTVFRNNTEFTVEVTPINQNIDVSLSEATQASFNIFKIGSRDAMYARLWSGTFPDTLRRLSDFVHENRHITGGMILDLRGGFGGAWYEYLDLFYPDRSNYFKHEIISREGAVEYYAEPKTNPNYYSGPMVVLIDNGTRSGKEALAHQFKKTERAVLIGETTQGAAMLGKGIFNSSTDSYFLYLSVAEVKIDGHRIEGIGVEPNIRVKYPIGLSTASDPQFRRAVVELSKVK